jgi:hypothetical protein
MLNVCEGIMVILDTFNTDLCHGWIEGSYLYYIINNKSDVTLHSIAGYNDQKVNNSSSERQNVKGKRDIRRF